MGVQNHIFLQVRRGISTPFPDLATPLEVYKNVRITCGGELLLLKLCWESFSSSSTVVGGVLRIDASLKHHTFLISRKHLTEPSLDLPGGFGLVLKQNGMNRRPDYYRRVRISFLKQAFYYSHYWNIR